MVFLALFALGTSNNLKGGDYTCLVGSEGSNCFAWNQSETTCICLVFTGNDCAGYINHESGGVILRKCDIDTQ